MYTVSINCTDWVDRYIKQAIGIFENKYNINRTFRIDVDKN